MNMKRRTFLPLAILLFLIGSWHTMAQKLPQEAGDTIAENDTKELLMYKFEPDYLVSVELRREEIKKAKESLDTMDISDRMRKKLLKDLLMNKPTKRLSKVGVGMATNHYEDD